MLLEGFGPLSQSYTVHRDRFYIPTCPICLHGDLDMSKTNVANFPVYHKAVSMLNVACLGQFHFSWWF